MDDIIFGLLSAIFEVLLEGIFEYVLTAFADICLRGLMKVLDLPQSWNSALAAVGYAFLGFAIGGLSLIPFPHPLVHPSKIHGVSLVLSPLIAGLLMSLTGSFLRKQEKRVLQLETFGY